MCGPEANAQCTFLNTCIGRRNYSTFLAFVISAVLAIILVLALSIARAASARPVLSSYSAIGSLIVAILCVAVGVPIGGLLSYHLRLIWLGTTTIEMVRRPSHL